MPGELVPLIRRGVPARRGSSRHPARQLISERQALPGRKRNRR
jgi:hypothetical protein